MGGVGSGRNPAKSPFRKEQPNDPSTSGVVRIEDAAITQAPEMLAQWDDQTELEWGALWDSPQATLMRPTELPVIYRLFSYRQLLRQTLAMAMSQEPENQEARSSLLSDISRLESGVRNLEDRLGLSPYGLLKLGVTFEQRKSIATQNNLFEPIPLFDDDPRED